VGAKSLGVVSVAGYIQNVSVRQHPIFVFLSDRNFFQETENSKTRNRKLLFDFSGLLLCLPPFGAALFSDGRVLGAPPESVNPPNDKNDIF
jgi:hypothetical protein